MTVQAIPLDLQGRPLTLQVYAGDGARFARLFMATWSQIPLPARQRVVDHWTKEEYPVVLLELSNCWKNCLTRDAETRLWGCELKFNAAESDRMPEEVGKALIAHELAHVYQHAVGINERTYDELESDAEDLISSWGFDWVAKIVWRAKREMGMLEQGNG